MLTSWLETAPQVLDADTQINPWDLQLRWISCNAIAKYWSVNRASLRKNGIQYIEH